MKTVKIRNVLAIVTLSEVLTGCVGSGVNDYFFTNEQGQHDDAGAGSDPTGGSGGSGGDASTPTPSPTVAPTATPSPSPSATPSPTPNCTIDTTTKDIRILFMIDNSGSTASTDPNHYYRVQTIQNFIARYGSHTNLTYSFGYFSGTTANEWDMNLNRFRNPATNYFGDSTGLSVALNSYKNINSSGNTPYTAAFNALKAEIHADEAAGVKKDYIVVFMSDGQPTDISGNVASGIISMVDQLKVEAQANGTSSLSVSSVYFGPAGDNVSIGNLQTMASEGSGQFVDTNTTTALSINDIINVPNCN